MSRALACAPVSAVPAFSNQLLNRWLQDSFARFESPSLSQTQGPAVIVYETSEAFVVQAELPGWLPNQVTVDFENQTLTLKGNRELPTDDTRKYHRVEGFFGQFTRSFKIPSTIDVDAVKADLKEGVLTITLPKKESVRSRQITIEAN